MKVSASCTASSWVAAIPVMPSVFDVPLVSVVMRSASWRPLSPVPSLVATASGTGPVVVSTAIWSRLVNADG